MVLLTAEPVSLNLNAAAFQAPAPHSSVLRRRMWAAVWLVGMILLLFGLDVIEARRLQRRVNQFQADASGSTTFVDPLQVGRYLDQGAAPPLAVLAQIADSTPKGMMLSNISYERGGMVQISGTAKNADQFNAYLRQLAESTLFIDVAPISTNIKDDKWTFRVETRAIPVQRYVMRAPPPEKPESENHKKDGGS